MKAVSVVVACYNASMYLDKCIEHLLRQTIGIENMEILLVNDASTDDGKTWNLILQYEKQYPDTIIAVSLEHNMRQGGARNVGISYAGGEYLIFCDADDWLLEEALEHSYRAAKQYDVDVVEFLIADVTDRAASVELAAGRRNCLTVLDTEEKRKSFLLTINDDHTLGSQRKLYKRSLICDNHIAFAEHLIFEEPSFTVPLRLYMKSYFFLDEILYVAYLSPGSTLRGAWEGHQWDNSKVWLHLMADLEERGLLQQYYSELEYLFLKWGFGLSIRVRILKGYGLQKDELGFLQNMVKGLFPDAEKNVYLNQKVSDTDVAVLELLSLEATDENLQAVNDGKYI